MNEQMGHEYKLSRLRMQEIAQGLSDEDSHRIVPACPEWTVKDLFSHVTGLAADLGGGKGPTGDTQVWVDALVSDRRERTLSSVVDEWNEVAPAFEAMIDAMPKRLWALSYDTVVHEHDLRNAVRQPGQRDSSGVKMSAVLGLKLVKGDLATKSLPAFCAVIDGVEHVVGEGEPVLTLRASAFETLRLLGSRRTDSEMREADFVGDLDGLWSGITHMSLPKVSLGE
jgi:uncharacterized protein (TIGR03083 family)